VLRLSRGSFAFLGAKSFAAVGDPSVAFQKGGAFPALGGSPKVGKLTLFQTSRAEHRKARTVLAPRNAPGPQVRCAGMGWDGMGWDGMGWDGVGWDEVGWDAFGWDWFGWDGMG
jgi:hypothetical protein